MKKPEWLYSWTWTEADEFRLSGAASGLDTLANELSALAKNCYSQGKNALASNLVTDAGTHYEDELKIWKQRIESDIVPNLKASAAAIRATVEERRTIWDQFRIKVKDFNEWAKENGEDLIEMLI